MPSSHTYDICIVVFKGTERDQHEDRHVGLWCVPQRGGKGYYFTVKGEPGCFVHDFMEDDYPKDRPHIKLEAIRTSGAITSSDLKDIMSSAEIDNGDKSHNSQHWVGSALETLEKKGLLMEGQASDAIDEMAGGVTGDQEWEVVKGSSE